MRKAFVLVSVEMGADDEVEAELKKVEKIRGVYQVYGVYDIVLEVAAETDAELKEVILSRIRQIKHVKGTLTLSAVS